MEEGRGRGKYRRRKDVGKMTIRVSEKATKNTTVYLKRKTYTTHNSVYIYTYTVLINFSHLG